MKLQNTIKIISHLILAIGLALFVYGIFSNVLDIYVFRESLFFGYALLYIGGFSFLVYKIIARRSDDQPVMRLVIGAVFLCTLAIFHYILLMVVFAGVSR